MGEGWPPSKLRTRTDYFKNRINFYHNNNKFAANGGSKFMRGTIRHGAKHLEKYNFEAQEASLQITIKL